MNSPLCQDVRQDRSHQTTILGADNQVLDVPMPILGIEHADILEQGSSGNESGPQGDNLALEHRVVATDRAYLYAVLADDVVSGTVKGDIMSKSD